MPRIHGKASWIGLILLLLMVPVLGGFGRLPGEMASGNVLLPERAPSGCPGCPREDLALDPEQSAGIAAISLPEPERLDDFFEEEVWAKVGERTCLNCHSTGGEASESKFLLRDLSTGPDALLHNLKVFVRMASHRKDGKSRLLVKVSGGLDHGGGSPLKPGSTGYGILERFVRRLESSPSGEFGPSAGTRRPPFFQGVRMASPGFLLRRVTLSLAGRLPTPEEKSAVEGKGLEALGEILDVILKEEAFFDRLKEGFNDIFLTIGTEGNADDVLSYDHFEKTRHWAEKYDLNHIPEKDRQKARYALYDHYRKALLREPMELVKYIVKNDRPFTEIVTADYFMASPYTARGYGIFEQLKERFKNPDDPYEYVVAKLPALKGRDGKVQPTEQGLYPHAGLLTMFQYLRRYPTTVTNRNRLRARMYYRHFLGIDVMALAPRVTDAAAIGKKFANPTLQAPDCVVCHKTIDPVAGLFQDYFNEEGHYGPRKGGWFTDMFAPGCEAEPLLANDRWRSLQWLGQVTAKDPRFAVAMVEHVYSILMGRKVLLAPQDIDDPTFNPRRRAYLEQRRTIRSFAERFSRSGFNLKTIFKDWICSPYYQVDGLSGPCRDAARRAELDDIGVVHLLTPEQLERKILAVFGQPWGRLEGDYRILYGGIDSKAVTERMTDPSGAMGAIQRIMSNDVACKNVALDFSRAPDQRRLFPGIEPSVVPGASAEADHEIRQAIVHLETVVLGRNPSLEDPEVERAWQLFKGIYEEARDRKGIPPKENYFCGDAKEHRPDDPKYTIRAWRAVVTYLLRQDDFLYE